MHLNEDSAGRFFSLLDGLTTYFMQSLDPAAFTQLTQGCSQDEALHAVRKAMFNDPFVIDRFLADDVFQLPEEDKAVIKSWKNALSGTFFVTEHTPAHSLFMSDDLMFGVRGLTQEIAELLPNVPALVETTLLPYEGVIVYDVQLAESSIGFGSGLQEMMETWRKEAMGKGVICNGDALATLVPSIKARRKEQAQKMKDDEDELQRLREHPEERDTTGYHKGVLAGMTPEQRREAIDKRMDEIINTDDLFKDGEMFYSSAVACSVEGEPLTSYKEQLMVQTNGDPFGYIKERFVAQLGDEAKAKIAMADLKVVDQESAAGLLAGAIAKSAETATNDIVLMDDSSYTTLRGLMMKGGEQLFTEEDARAGKMRSIITNQPYTIMFHHGEQFTLLIPEELRELLQKLDWTKIERRRNTLELIENTMATLTQMCGIVAKKDAYACFKDWYPKDAKTLKIDDFWDYTMGLATERPETDVCQWTDPKTGESYGLCYQLAIELDQAEKALEDGAEEAQEELDNVNDYIAYLLKRHAQVGFKRLPIALRDADPFEYKIGLPSGVALQSFLDAHVPDEKDDCFFADHAMEAIVEMTESGMQFQDIFKELQEKEGLVLDMVDTQDFLDLLMSFLNALPRWEDNGAAPVDVR